MDTPSWSLHKKKILPQKTNKQTKKNRDGNSFENSHQKPIRNYHKTSPTQTHTNIIYFFILYAISILGDYETTKTEKPGHLDLPHNSLQN
jgi:hypothetical protein